MVASLRLPKEICVPEVLLLLRWIPHPPTIISNISRVTHNWKVAPGGVPIIPNLPGKSSTLAGVGPRTVSPIPISTTNLTLSISVLMCPPLL